MAYPTLLWGSHLQTPPPDSRYIDGVENERYTSNVQLAADDRWSLGQEYDNSTRSDFWDGQLDEAVAYDRALSADEVQALAQGESPSHEGREYFHYNAVGHVVSNTKDTQDVVQVSVYEAFGNRISQSETDGGSSNNRLANTKERDATIGLDNHGFRYYDPEIGRYLTRDPIGYGDGLNVYVHVRNNPINFMDPLGLKTVRLSIWRSFFSEIGTQIRRVKDRIDAGASESITLTGHAVGLIDSDTAARRSSTIQDFTSQLQEGASPHEVMRGALVDIATAPATVPYAIGSKGSQAALDGDLQGVADSFQEGGTFFASQALGAGRGGRGRGRGGAESDATSTGFSEPTPEGIANIERHLDREKIRSLDETGNAAMIERLKAGERTEHDMNFYNHETIEASIMDADASVSARDAHLRTLETQGIPYDAKTDSKLFHPDVIRENPKIFNPKSHPDADS